jgi:hypothetical protein
MCKRCEYLARRAADVNGEIMTDGRGVEEVKFDGFAVEHANLLAL